MGFAVVLVIGVVSWIARRFFNRTLTIALGSLLALAFVGAAVWIEWQCQSTLQLPLPATGDNDGTVRVLMLAAGGLALVALATAVGAVLGWLMPVRRKPGAFA
jgi:hypothetical protein